jgi:APA family basic amino acid/polyamine antiporter
MTRAPGEGVNFLKAETASLFAFTAVALAVMILRVKDKQRRRPFRTPAVWVVGPLAVAGCLGLF